jgi:integrase
MAGSATPYGKLPRGVELRKGKKGDTLRITFHFRGVRCREPLAIEANRDNIRYAANLLGEIENAIAHKSFDYRKYFPNSKRATALGFAMVPDITIGQMLTEYLAIAEKTLSPSTVRGYHEVTKAHLRPKFGNVLVRDLTPSMLRLWLAGLTVTQKRVKNILCPLSNVLQQALTDELIPFNPLDKIVLGKILPKENKSKYVVEPFDSNEISLILNACKTIQERALWQFAFATGVRTSELISLRWGDIDWNKLEFKICRVKVVGNKGPVEKDYGKTAKALRIVPLLPAAIEALESMKPISYMAQRYIFTHPITDDQWMDDQQLRESSWKATLRRAGVRYRNPYQTRHTFATTLLMNGESEMLVAELLGHETTEMVKRHYTEWIKTVSTRPKGDYSSFAGGKNLGQIWGSEGPFNPVKTEIKQA